MIINKKEMYDCISDMTIATLGPKGTSSEFVAKYLTSRLGIDDKNISLFDSYEEAFKSVKKRKNNLLLVANAYKNIHNFYMDDEITLIGSFIKETPLYGIASKKFEKKDFFSKKCIKVVSHHAPKSMIDTIEKRYNLNIGITDCLSTSEAAAFVQEEKYDYCLTNEQAKREYELNFILPIKQITMVWSLFGQKQYIPIFDLLNKMDKFS